MANQDPEKVWAKRGIGEVQGYFNKTGLVVHMAELYVYGYPSSIDIWPAGPCVFKRAGEHTWYARSKIYVNYKDSSPEGLETIGPFNSLEEAKGFALLLHASRT